MIISLNQIWPLKKILLASGLVLMGMAVLWLAGFVTVSGESFVPVAGIGDAEAIDKVKSLTEVVCQQFGQGWVKSEIERRGQREHMECEGV